MKTHTRFAVATASILVVGVVYLALRVPAGAHCDTMDGPVIRDARRALNTARVTPTLKWVSEEQEAEIVRVFKQAQAARGESGAAKIVADQLFFETLVRLHRTSEGEPYTGVKPSGTDVGPIVHMGDRALDSGKVDALAKAIATEVGNGIRRRFADAYAKSKTADHSVSAGREFVAAYVEFMHYAEGVHKAATGRPDSHAEHAEAPAHKH